MAYGKPNWGRCQKKTVSCTIICRDGAVYSGLNICHTDGKVCPREAAGMESGEGYYLCGPPVHAEIDALRYAQEMGADLRGAKARLKGHTYFCMECQHALSEAGVKTFIIEDDS